MIINCDAKALEIVCAGYLSRDEVLYDELRRSVDIHANNQERFKLPSRLIAKTFVFRLIYGGSAYSYANDPDFAEVKGNEKFWQGVIDEFYNKYKGIQTWHTALVTEASSTGKLCMPTGRFYNFESTMRRGNLEWPRTKILNYPVQGLGADIVSIARAITRIKWKEQKIEGVLISTIHDSIVADVADQEVERVCQLFLDVFNEIPQYFERLFGIPFDLPTKSEISYGNNKYDLKVWEKDAIILL